ncbi:TPA: ATP synthase F1 subunit gamma [Candidatus Sumerlaeota bacterium]|jgi:F-type H+-transporting ATPase subunit gamma|nr:ATP synthase F1 subunit gamma [Candidatus Sumerlaeota bacterium]
MAESLKSLRRRVRSIKSTKQITRAMEMVSAAKLRRAQSALLAARPYIQNLEIMLGRLAPAAQSSGHPLFAQRNVKRSTIVLFTADRGLCGSYNANLIRIAETHLKQDTHQRTELICVGKRGFEYFSRRAWPIAAEFTDMGGVLNSETAAKISTFITDRFLEGKTDEVHLLYTNFISAANCKPTFEKFLSLDYDALSQKVDPADRASMDYIFEPSEQGIFEQLIPAYLFAKLYIVLAEGFTSEHSSRMLAMNNATKSCDEMISTLTLSLNKARQSSITNDLLDIVGGAEALQKGS